MRFGKGAEAFGLPYEKASNFEEFKYMYKQVILRDTPSILEAQVVGREENVQIHKEITVMALDVIDNILGNNTPLKSSCENMRLPTKIFKKDEIKQKKQFEQQNHPKVLVLLHGWMGDKNEWEEVATSLMQDLPNDWSIISVDLPGHGEAQSLRSGPTRTFRTMLSLDSSIDGNVNEYLSVDSISECVLQSLSKEYNLKNIDALAGYSLGGRIALSMKKLCSLDTYSGNRLISEDTQLILLGSYPGNLHSPNNQYQFATERSERKLKDQALSKEILRIYERSYVLHDLQSKKSKLWAHFLTKWYGYNFLWAEIERRNCYAYQKMVERRIHALNDRAPDFAHILEICSPGRNSADDWKYISPKYTHFLAGQLDKKYSELGKLWTKKEKYLRYHEIPNAGHAVLVEAANEVSKIILSILSERSEILQLHNPNKFKIKSHSSSSNNFEEKKRGLVKPIEDKVMTYIKPGVFDMETFMINHDERLYL